MQFKLLANDFKEFLSLMLTDNDKENLWRRVHGGEVDEAEYLANEFRIWDDLAVEDLVKELNKTGKVMFYQPLVLDKGVVKCGLQLGVVFPKIKKYILENEIK